MTEWRDVDGYEGYYQVSDLGQVRSLPRLIQQGKRKVFIKGRILKQNSDTNGYQIVVLSKDGIHKSCRMHRIVAEAFLPNPEGKTEVNHINGNKKDNRAVNLEWNSRKENVIHSQQNGLAKAPPAPIKKKVLQFSKDGNLIKVFDSIKIAGESTQIDTSDICNCCRRNRKSAGGYVWKYVLESEVILV
jgi:hypothetical protein